MSNSSLALFFGLIFSLFTQAHPRCHSALYLEGLRTGYRTLQAKLAETTNTEAKAQLEKELEWIRDEYQLLTGMAITAIPEQTEKAGLVDEITLPVALVRVSTSGSFAVWADTDAMKLTVVRVLDGNSLFEIPKSEHPFTDAVFLSDDELLTIDSESQLQIWKLTSGEPKLIHQAFAGVPDATSLSVSDDKLHLAVGGTDGIAIWNLKSKNQIAMMLLPATQVTKVALESGARNVLYVDGRKRAFLRSVAGNSKLLVDVGSNNPVHDIALVSTNSQRKAFILAERGLLVYEDFRNPVKRYLLFEDFVGDHLLIRKNKPPAIVGADPERIHNYVATVDDTSYEHLEKNRLVGLLPGISSAKVVSEHRFLAASATRSLLKIYPLPTVSTGAKK